MSKVYFSGFRAFKGFGDEPELTQLTGWTNRCYSYAYVANGGRHYSKQVEQGMDWCLTNKLGVMLDSGGFTLFNVPNIEAHLPAYLDGYVDWVKKRKGAFDFYVNVDYVQDAPKVFKVMQQLRKRGLKPVPVYHGDSGIEWMERYIDLGCDLIGLGTMMNNLDRNQRFRFFARCFELSEKRKVKLHGFSVTSQLMLRFPWHSVDSTSWMMAAVHGQVIYFDESRSRVVPMHISTTRDVKSLMGSKASNLADGSVVAALHEQAAKFGIDWDSMCQESFWRAVFNIRVFLHMANARRRTTPTWATIV